MGETTADSREGSQFGPYRLRRLIGRGGMGDVYEAEDTVRERIVALKLMSKTLSNDPVFRPRLPRRRLPRAADGLPPADRCPGRRVGPVLLCGGPAVPRRRTGVNRRCPAASPGCGSAWPPSWS